MGVQEHAGVSPGDRVTRLRVAEPASPDPVELAERALKTAIGLASLAAGFVASAIADAIRDETSKPSEEPPDDEAWPKPLLPVLAGAGLGLALDSARAGARVASTVGRSLVPWISFAKSPTFVRERLGRVRELVNELDERWHAEQQEDERIGSAFVRAVAPHVVDAALSQVDLTEVVLELDLDRVIGAVDLDRVLDRIDVEAIAGRLDLDRIVARVDLRRVMERIDIQDIVDRVDIQRIVERLDIDAVAARIDVESIVRRLDLAAIANEVIVEIDLMQIIREASGTMANETVEGIRAQGASADQAVSRLVDRVLGRRRTLD